MKKRANYKNRVKKQQSRVPLSPKAGVVRRCAEHGSHGPLERRAAIILSVTCGHSSLQGLETRKADIRWRASSSSVFSAEPTFCNTDLISDHRLKEKARMLAPRKPPAPSGRGYPLVAPVRGRRPLLCFFVYSTRMRPSQ